MPNEIPILFGGDMVRAIRRRKKTVTRRLSDRWMRVKAGDLLWTRETWIAERHGSYEPIARGDRTHDMSIPWTCSIAYRADYPLDLDEHKGFYRPSIHMPRWASRNLLRATEDARREPLQEITEEDAKAEGVELTDEVTGCADDLDGSYIKAYSILWDSLHNKKPFAGNPAVTRLAFEVVNG